jgi:cytochrome P450
MQAILQQEVDTVLKGKVRCRESRMSLATKLVRYNHVWYVQVVLSLQVMACAICCATHAMQAPSADDLEHMPYLSAVIDEALRLRTPADSTVRVLNQDLRLPDGKV